MQSAIPVCIGIHVMRLTLVLLHYIHTMFEIEATHLPPWFPYSSVNKVVLHYCNS